MSVTGFSETRLVTCVAFVCFITALLWVPWHQTGLSGSAPTLLGYGLLWSPAYRAIAGASIDWSRVGAAIAATAMVWGILQMVLEPFNAANTS
jgi:hypothetical protein